MRVHYDIEGDFLEISIGNSTECYADEIEPGIFLRKDEKTNEVRGVGILGFKQKSKKMQDIEVMLPLKLSISAS